MGWAFFPALFLGLYGFSVHPLIGLVGLVVPFAIAHALKTEREKREKAHQDCEARSAENDRRRRFSQQASEMSSAENDTRRRIAQQASEMRSAENDRLRRIADLGALEGRLRDRLNEKLEELLYTFRLTVRTSPLGVRDYRRFDKEVLRFLEAGIAPGDQTTLIHNNTFLRDIYETCFREQLHSNLESHQARQCSAMPSYRITSPLDFERQCAERFRFGGWQVTETPASGDQGVDLIAKRDGQIIAVQCKFYSQPVGNSAVQEVAAGKIHYGANTAVVISTGGYTGSAAALAKSNDVLLLHPDDILGLGSRAGHFAQSERRSGRHLDWPPRRYHGN